MATLARFNLAVLAANDANLLALLNNASIQVWNEIGGALASLYSDRAGSAALGNPYTAADGADGGFHVVGGVYKITATSGALTRTWRYVAVGTMSEHDYDGVPYALAREMLTTNRTYYVLTTGSNSNTGLVNNAGGAFLTGQKAIDVIFGTLDLAGFDVVVQFGAGTYTGAIVANSPQVGKGTVTLRGDVATPANVLFNVASQCLTVQNYAAVNIEGVKPSSTAGVGSLYAQAGGVIRFNAIDFGTASSNHIRSDLNGTIIAIGNYAISGGAARHWLAIQQGFIQVQSRTITFSGTPTFTTAFAVADIQSLLHIPLDTFVGTFVGKRYIANAVSIINTNTAGPNYLPGTIAGDVPTNGAFYI